MHLLNGNVKFSHTNRKHFTVSDPMAFPIVKMGNKNPKPPLPLARCGPSSNTAMPLPTALTTADHNSDGWVTVAHVRRKVPIGYNCTPQICPQKYLFLLSDPQSPLSASSLDSFDPWCQMTSVSDLPFFHNALDRLMHRPTDCPRKNLMTVGRCAPRVTWPDNALAYWRQTM